MTKSWYDVWVKASRVEDQNNDFKDVIILKDKSDGYIYYTTVDADQVIYREDNDRTTNVYK